MYRRLRRVVGDHVRGHRRAEDALVALENGVERARHTLKASLPILVRPKPFKIMVAVTANCNARCTGCRYGRDFMPGASLDLATVEELLEDAAAAGFYSIRFYGGEPLVHPEIDRMVARCVELGMKPYLTTNAILLRDRLDDLYAAGLRDVTVGFYGIGDEYDAYTGRPGAYEKVERSLAYAGERYAGRVELQMNWLLMRPTATVGHFDGALEVARRHGMSVRVDLVHYSLPYFQEGPERELQFRPEDRPAIEAVVERMLEVKRTEPGLLRHSLEGLRSIPDWLVKGPDMRVPCTAYEMIWVGADGTVQMCYVTFELGNLRERRFSEMLGTAAHRSAARAAVTLDCPNCHCSSNERVTRHAPTHAVYAREGAHRAEPGRSAS